MNILALDLGTSTGWAALEDGRLEFGTMLFDVRRGESPGMRFLRFNRWLDEMALDRARTKRYDVLVYEQAHQRGGAATEVLVGMATRVLEFAAAHEMQHAGVHTATLKKWASGAGNADKAMMHAAVIARWGVTPTTHDEADAIALAYYARDTWKARH